MRILVGCEYSQIVTEAFMLRGHDVISCDLLPGEKGLPHYQGNIFDIINDGFDMAIFFPPCDNISKVGARYWKEKQENGSQAQAIDFVYKLYNCSIPMVCIENPVGILSSVWRKPDNVIHPAMFGDPYLKQTCLWLKNLPPLLYTHVERPVAHWVSS